MNTLLKENMLLLEAPSSAMFYPLYFQGGF